MKSSIKYPALFLAFAITLSSVVIAETQPITIRGFVTNIVSPTSFEIEDYRIERDPDLILEIEKADSALSVYVGPVDIRIGTEVRINGLYHEETGIVEAQSIMIFLEEFKRIKRTALLERPPKLVRESDGWVGRFFADGQRIQVRPSTEVVFKLNKSERIALKKEARKKRKGVNEQQEEAMRNYIRPLQSLDEIGPDTFMTYEGYREDDGSIFALKLEFMRNELLNREVKLGRTLTPKIREPNYEKLKPGVLSITRVGAFKLVPSEEAQAYIRRIGESLIPYYQRSLADDDPNKIPFKFFLVKGKQFNAFSLPNGVIVVFSPIFELLENEAQLASVLGHEIAHAIQEHLRRQRDHRRGELIAIRIGAIAAAAMGVNVVPDVLDMTANAIRNGYSRKLENQADRIGLEYMVAAGYDPREAPRVWKLMAENNSVLISQLFWGRHDNHTLRRSYLMAELRNNYADLNPNDIKRNEDEFQRMAQIVEGTINKKKIK